MPSAGVCRLVPSCVSREGSVPCLFSSLWWLLATLGILWLVAASLPSLPPLSHGSLSMSLSTMYATSCTDGNDSVRAHCNSA